MDNHPTPMLPPPAAAFVRYRVGDCYDAAGRRGIVFETDPTGTHGKILSLHQSPSPLPWCTGGDEDDAYAFRSGASDPGDGLKNRACLLRFAERRASFPAFAWCEELGEGWYLPAEDEWCAVRRNLRTVRQTVARIGADPVDDCYWSSTGDGERFARYVGMSDLPGYAAHSRYDAGWQSSAFESERLAVRAVAVF